MLLRRRQRLTYDEAKYALLRKLDSDAMSNVAKQVIYYIDDVKPSDISESKEEIFEICVLAFTGRQYKLYNGRRLLDMDMPQTTLYRLLTEFVDLFIDGEKFVR